MVWIDDDQLIDGFLDDLRLQGKSIHTISDYRCCILMYHRWLKRQQGLHICSVNSMKEKVIIENFLKFLWFEYAKKDGGVLSYKRLKSIFTALNGLYEYLEYNDLIEKNIILTVRKRYLKQFKNGYVPSERKWIDVKKMRAFINSIGNLRDKTMIVLGVKTGIRRGELIAIDVDDIDMDEMMISLKGRLFKKRSHPIVFFDAETKQLLYLWLKRRILFANEGERALFVGQYGNRIDKNAVYGAIVKWAKRFGIYDETSVHNKDHFSFHNLRHCFTTYLRQNGMPRDFIKELRGDKRGEVIDIYNHIDRTELKRAYLSCIPQLNFI